MWELDHKECWALKSWCFWTVVLDKTLYRVPWTAQRSKQSILKETNPEFSLKGLMLKLKLQYFGQLLGSANSLEKILMLGILKTGGEGDDRGWDGWMAWLTQWTWVWANSGRWWRTGMPEVLQSMGLQRIGHDWVTEQQLQHTSRIIQHPFFYLWPISVSIMFLSFIRVVAYIKISFFTKAELYSIVCICHILFIQSTFSEHLG